MLLKRFYHDGLAQASYLLGCQKTGEAIVVDANRGIQAYIDAARENGLRVTHVTETHIHADYLSGSRELARTTGAQLLLSAEGGDDWQYAFAESDGATLLRDGESFMIGNLKIDVVHTPGHTPEHLTFVVTDTPASDRPVGAFTGDFIFVGDVGRPDLLERAAHVQGTMRIGGASLFASLRRFVSTYPDYLQLWPGHGSGSACGKALGAVPQTTLGYEKIANWALQIPDEASFVDAVLEGQPDPPRYFATMKRLNRAGPALIGDALPLPREDDAALGSAISTGIVIDLRRADAFAAGGVRGTLSIPLNKSFVGWAGWLIPYDRDIRFIVAGDDAQAADDAARELRMIGLDRGVGWFAESAVEGWRADGGAIVVIPQVVPPDVASALERGTVHVLDVRAESEWLEGHVDGARHIPLGHLEERIDELDPAQPLAVHCRGGGRSMIAASLLAARGFADVRNVAGGLEAWTSAGLPVVGDTVRSSV